MFDKQPLFAVLEFTFLSAALPVDPLEMNVDRPFYYAIVNPMSGLALFQGHVTEPLAGN